MKIEDDIKEKVLHTIDSAAFIEKQNVSPFFKEKVMHQVRNMSVNESGSRLNWFPLQLQFAIFLCVVVLNAFVLTRTAKVNSYEANVNELAEIYGWSDSSAENSIFNE